ncbi:MAG: LysM peptidoglycan-binding domain-containing protein [Anaerolineales bacterium]|nr:LysM peptidoglycan-binding domain-containing protein [Anaerolineales bacterium]
MILAILACVRQAVRDGAEVDGRVTPVDGNVKRPSRTIPGTYMPWGDRELVYSTVSVTGTPTPDSTRPAQARPVQQVHVVQRGDTLSAIARVYQVSLEALKHDNGIGPSDTISIGQNLSIPEYYLTVGPAHKLIPDSELVYSPGQIGFDLEGAVDEWGGYLSTFSETDRFGRTRSGSEIVLWVSQHYSVNPRLLLVVLEQRTGWVLNPSPGDVSQSYPFGYVKAGYSGLLRQLSWAADRLNAGFYGWREESLSVIDIKDGTQLGLAPG